MAQVTQELLKKQLEAFLAGLEPDKASDKYGYYMTLYLDELDELDGDGRNTEDDIALAVMQYPQLHDLARALIDKLTGYNSENRPMWAGDEEHAGAGLARELALAYAGDVERYARYVVTNDLNHEVYQADDIDAILKKWGVGSQTYLLMVARWFAPGQHADEQLEEYYEEMQEVFEDPAERDAFLGACARWFLEDWLGYQKVEHKKEELNQLFSELFDEVQYFEEYEQEHEDDDDFDYERDVYGPVVNKFVALVQAGKTPAFEQLTKGLA